MNQNAGNQGRHLVQPRPGGQEPRSKTALTGQLGVAPRARG